ncbi:alanine racemase, partial [Mesorhizobium sp.]
MNGASKKSLPERVAVKAAPISEAAAGAILTVDLGAIRENYRRLKARLGDVGCAGVVKADGYGLGGAQVAAALAAEGCATFFVAHLAEGVLLRQALGARPAIYVLNGIQPGAESEAVEAELGVVINSAGQLAAWRSAAQRAGRKLKAAIQVDSGMSRLGMAAAEVEAVTADPRAFDGINATFVMSHLARA